MPRLPMASGKIPLQRLLNRQSPSVFTHSAGISGRSDRPSLCSKP